MLKYVEIFYLGRYQPQRLWVIISSHMIGSIFAAVCFYALFPIESIRNQTLAPFHYNTSNLGICEGFIQETVLSYIYSLILLIMPEVLSVNNLSRYLIIIPLLPIMFLRLSSDTSVFNPCAIYALWYVNGSNTSLCLERCLGSFIGSCFAGYTCTLCFPDDRLSWIPKKRLI